MRECGDGLKMWSCAHKFLLWMTHILTHQCIGHILYAYIYVYICTVLAQELACTG